MEVHPCSIEKSLVVNVKWATPVKCQYKNYDECLYAVDCFLIQGFFSYLKLKRSIKSTFWEGRGTSTHLAFIVGRYTYLLKQQHLYNENIYVGTEWLAVKFQNFVRSLR